MKDYQQCCDEVAKKRGYSNYKEFCKYDLLSTQMMEQICELYASEVAREKVKEAIPFIRSGHYKRDNIEEWNYYHTEQEILSKLNL